MKKSTQYILLAIFALLVLIVLQAYSVVRIYQLEKDRFENRYKETILKGLDKLEETVPDLGLETAYYILDENSSYFLDLLSSGEISDTMVFRSLLLKNVHNTFEEYQKLNSLVGIILEKNNISTPFTTHFVFREYKLESWTDSLNVYEAKRDMAWEYPDTLNISAKAFFLGGYAYVGTNFRCKYDFVIDFSEMERFVLKQIAGILLLMIISLIIVGLIFIVTVRNMLEERRLSLLKTDFINNMTHELKTPLSTIAIATKSLQQDSFMTDPNKVKSTARIIGRQNTQLSKQINHLLEVSMWERQQFELDKRWTNLHEFMSDLAEAFRWERKDQAVVVISDCQINKDLEIFIDETQMATAIHNLMVNGVKYNEKDPVIEISCLIEDSIVIKVKDNGIGISKESSKHIFEKFYRVHTGNIHKVKGLGLGLFYVKQIVEAHGGMVNMKSKIGKGTEFTIKLPNNGRSNNSTR